MVSRSGSIKTVRAKQVPALGESGPWADTGGRGLDRKRQGRPWSLDLGLQDMEGDMAE